MAGQEKTMYTMNSNDIASYMRMLRYCRPSRSETEHTFIEDYIIPTGAIADKHGNYIHRIGDSPVLWSSHTDTVHTVCGYQGVIVNGDLIQLPRISKSNCLGADCTTGVWIMLEMIKHSVPGLYIFHRDEECGGQGSRYIARETPEVLDGIKFAIAFDRFGFNSIVTEQWGGKCASRNFAESISHQLPGSAYGWDDTGTFTDTANYMSIVPECSNISVGYNNQHSATENQSISHMLALRDAMVKIDITQVQATRDPEDDWRRYYYAGQHEEEDDDDGYTLREISMETLVKYYPEEVADFLSECGFSTWELTQEIKKRRNL